MDPWTVQLILVRDEVVGAGGRRALARDVERSVLVRVRRGVDVRFEVWEALDPWSRLVVGMRALAAVAERRPVFSHWSAAALLGLPCMAPHVPGPHVTVTAPGRRGASGAATHVLPLLGHEVTEIRGLLVTSVARTVIDVAAASAFRDGVVIADGALAAGFPRELLEAAVDLAGPRRGIAVAGDVVAFAHPGGESANESIGRASMLLLGVEPPELQHEFRDDRGLIGFADDWWERLRAIGEADGAITYLDPGLSKEEAKQVLRREKLREDRMRAQADRFVRWGWEESCDPGLLGPVLARAGVLPLRRRPTLADWAAAARTARPRRPRAGFDR